MPLFRSRNMKGQSTMKKNKAVIVRMDEDLKIEFSVALLRQRIKMQDFFTQIARDFVAHDKSQKNPYFTALLKKINEP